MGKKSKYKKQNKEYRVLSKETVLPEWLTAELPEHKRKIIISYQDGVFHYPDTETPFTDIVSAYDAADSYEDAQVVLDESVNGHGGRLKRGLMFVDPEEGKTSSRLLISHTSEDTVGLLKYAYGIWLKEIHPAYLKDQDNWVQAYNWLRVHPAFWHRFTEEKTFNWETDDGTTDFRMWVRQESKKPKVYLEAGAHVAPGYKTFYADFRLEVSAKTMEDAYVKLAKRVNKFFNPDGTEKENVKYKKSAREKQLDAAFAETPEADA